MNVRYINPFIEAASNAFATFLQAKITPQKPVIFNPENNDLHYDISGIIGLAGEVKGVVVVSLPKLVALKIISGISDRDIKIFDDDVVDAIGEAINIIAGNAKRGLMDFKIAISLPSIIKGVNHRITWMAGVPVILIPFECEYGPVYLFISMKELL